MVSADANDVVGGNARFLVFNVAQEEPTIVTAGDLRVSPFFYVPGRGMVRRYPSFLIDARAPLGLAHRPDRLEQVPGAFAKALRPALFFENLPQQSARLGKIEAAFDAVLALLE